MDTTAAIGIGLKAMPTAMGRMSVIVSSNISPTYPVKKIYNFLRFSVVNISHAAAWEGLNN
jgi:hypothetical protein